MQIMEWAQKAREASYVLSALEIEKRNAALRGIQRALQAYAEAMGETGPNGSKKKGLFR